MARRHRDHRSRHAVEIARLSQNDGFQDQLDSQLGHPADPLQGTDPRKYLPPAMRGWVIVAMSGNAGFTHDPVSVFEAARILKDNKDIKFLLSGEGVGWTKLKDMQAASPLPNVTLLERVPESELESFLSAGDIWVIPYRKDNTGVSVPSRIYNLLAVGRPIIICSEADAEAAILLREDDIGWVAPPEDPQALAQIISFAASADAGANEKGIERRSSRPAIQGKSR